MEGSSLLYVTNQPGIAVAIGIVVEERKCF